MRREQSVQAKKNNVEEMTHAPVRRLVTHLAIPSIVIMIITNIYNLADTAFVSQLGNSASGAVGIVFGFMAIIQAFGFMFGQGAGSMAAALYRRTEICTGKPDRLPQNCFFFSGGLPDHCIWPDFSR